MDEIYDLSSAYECCCKYVILDRNNSCGFLDDAKQRIKELETLISQSEDDNVEVLRKGGGINW